MGCAKTDSLMTHLDPLELLTISEFSRLIKRSRGALYKDIAAGRLHVVKLGRTTRIPRVEAERFVYGESRNGTAGDTDG